jgi:uncharacterized protein
MPGIGGGFFQVPIVDPLIALAGLLVGLVVGLTGMGGGALMTPILVIIFRVHPLAAIGSDLVASLFMKPVGGAVHWRKGNVEKSIAKWLLVGSVPAAFAGVFLVRLLGSGQLLQTRVQGALGGALLLASVGIIVKSYLDARRQRALGANPVATPVSTRRGATVAVGAVVGLIVGMTSVGSGSLMIVLLMLLYPMLSSRRLVGTDLVQAVPLVGAAALGHVLVGDFRLSLTASILVGSIPGVYIGSRFSASAPDIAVRPILVFVLLASALKLVNLSNVQLGEAAVAALLILPPVWGMIDAARWKPEQWARAGESRSVWLWWQGVGIVVVGVGLVASIVYFAKARPRLAAVAAMDERAAATSKEADAGMWANPRLVPSSMMDAGGD